VSDGPKPDAVAGGDTAKGRFSSRFVRPQAMRNLTGEQRAEERASTWLELFFDLCFVVAVAQAALPLHHDISEDHVAHGIRSYLMVFFAIWWAWMNFTWFASAYWYWRPGSTRRSSTATTPASRPGTW
jgi:hypothetical protein